MAYNDIKWIKDEAHWSQKIKNSLYLIGLGNLWERAHFSDVGIISIIRQRLEDIELQRWFSEMNNDIRKDPNQSNKMRTYPKVKTIDNYRCEDYLHQVTNPNCENVDRKYIFAAIKPPSNNVELQKIIEKHIRDCYEIRQKT